MQLLLNEGEKIICESKTANGFKWLLLSIIFGCGGIFATTFYLLEKWIGGWLFIIGIILILICILFFMSFIVLAKASKNVQLILTNKRIIIYDKKLHAYKNIDLKNLLNWELFNSYIFVFKTSDNITLKSGLISNSAEIYDELSRIMPEKCLGQKSEDVAPDNENSNKL